MRILSVLALVFVLQACTPIQATRGNFIRESEVAGVLPGATQTEILQKLGTPTSKAVFDENIWYYVGEKTAQKAFYRPEVEARTVYEARFDESGILTALNKVDGTAQNLEADSQETPAHGKSLTIMQQMLGNLGRFNKPAGSGNGAPEVPGAGI